MRTEHSLLERETAPRSAALEQLITAIRRLVRAEPNPSRVGRAVADTLLPYLEIEDLLTAPQLQSNPEKYQQHVLHVEPDASFSVASLVWLPGQETSIHDHVSWCVVGVYRGDEHETRYQLREGAEPFLTPAGTRINRRGSVDALVPPGDIHKVRNGGDGLAVSLHVYGADLAALGCSIRRRYDLPVR